jgi:hypothetical protein
MVAELSFGRIFRDLACLSKAADGGSSEGQSYPKPPVAARPKDNLII